MNDIIDRLRDATQAAGETISNVPPLELGGSRTRVNWFVPVTAAAAAMVAIAAGTLVVNGGGGPNQADGVGGSSAPPAFLVDARTGALVVRSAVDGAETDRRSDIGKGVVAVQAAQDNRLFYAISGKNSCGSSLYRFGINDYGRITDFAEEPMTEAAGYMATSLAVSGDGTKLAYGMQPCAVNARGEKLVLADLATGKSRVWTSTDDRNLFDLSLSADGNKFAFRRTSPVLTIATEQGTITSAEPLPVPDIEPSAMATVSSAEPLPSVEPSAIPTGGGAAKTEPAVTAWPPPQDSGTYWGIPEPSPAVAETVRPFEEPVPMDTATEDTVPTGEGVPPMVTSCAYTLPSAQPIPNGTKIVWNCAESPEVYVMDITQSGDTLDQARRLSIPSSFEGLIGGPHGVRISPDGKRLIGVMGFIGQTDLNVPQPSVSGDAGVVAISTADGHIEETLYRTNAGIGLQLLDVDGTGEHLLLARSGEIGTVNARTYRPILKAGEDAAWLTPANPDVAW
ncbi:hypothetical protein [Acrocarpospora catenulata]|uniref:hypothetical protein n=1 Tax=Acrocarpospora catenulata TaxID=2836182 RepID=UPI001BDAE58B|nr:hypothetical protein [Acrocarpospora catenulata]